jgi:formate hydrogenlyase subunit 6/NADH:ubiquinone oxidoreductase subunit I
MTSADELKKRREKEALRIRTSLNRQRSVQHSNTKGGENTVAFVEERLCIGCDQCDIVCDDDAIELYKVDMTSPLMNVESNRKARIIRDACTGCRLCVLACPTDAITMIDR